MEGGIRVHHEEIRESNSSSRGGAGRIEQRCSIHVLLRVLRCIVYTMDEFAFFQLTCRYKSNNRSFRQRAIFLSTKQVHTPHPSYTFVVQGNYGASRDATRLNSMLPKLPKLEQRPIVGVQVDWLAPVRQRLPSQAVRNGHPGSQFEREIWTTPDEVRETGKGQPPCPNSEQVRRHC